MKNLKEDKELLLRDLCARLPYKIRCSYYDICLLAHCNGEIYGIENKEYAIVDGKCIAIGFIKPYLFPLSSMTEEQKIKCFEGTDIELDENSEIWSKISLDTCIIITSMNNWLKVINWLLKNHFDIYGLIPKGLAIDCTNLNIY